MNSTEICGANAAEALRLAALGYRVFPCAAGAKEPLTRHGCHDATTDASRIEFWYARWATANVAIATEGLVVIDVDMLDKSGASPRPNPWLADQPDKAADLAAAPTQITWSGGRQHVFRLPADKKWRNSTGELAPGVDIKTTGGYVVVPPSVVEGRQYGWVDGCELDVAPESLPLPPAWLIAALDGVERVRGSAGAKDAARERLAALDAGDASDGHIVEGRRNATLYRIACRWRRDGMELDQIIEGLQRENAKRCNPPLASDELRKIAEHASQHKPAAAIELAENRTDTENGRRFAREHGGVAKYVEKWRKWIVWTGKRWIVDADNARVEKLAKATADAIWDDIEPIIKGSGDLKKVTTLQSWHKYTASAKGVAAMLRLARSEDGILISHDALDADPWLLNVKNGTIDLRTGKLREHRPEDLITQIAPVNYDADAECPRWRLFVSQIMGLHSVQYESDPVVRGELSREHAALCEYLQQLSGYCLTGATTVHTLPIFYGLGSNGKSLFLTTLQALLGTDYSMSAPQDMLLTKQNSSHPTELASLFGKRLCCAIEVEAGRRLNEALVKTLTGGDAIEARRMREDFWEFRPTHKIIIAANHRPVVRGQDDGLWRRLALIPFNVRFWDADKGESGPPELRQDKTLPAVLRAELPGILNWCILGCMKWQAMQSLAQPECVLRATEEYKNDSDTLREFFNERCELKVDRTAPSGVLYDTYRAWCAVNGVEPDTNRVFGNKLLERGFKRKHTMNGKVFTGIGLITNPIE